MLFLNEYYHCDCNCVSKPNNDIINSDTTTNINKNNNTNDIHLYNTAIECYILTDEVTSFLSQTRPCAQGELVPRGLLLLC